MEKIEKRVVITGIGAMTPIGNNVKDSWEGIKNKKLSNFQPTGERQNYHKIIAPSRV